LPETKSGNPSALGQLGRATSRCAKLSAEVASASGLAY
jgi:hypothetical protein